MQTSLPRTYQLHSQRPSTICDAQGRASSSPISILDQDAHTIFVLNQNFQTVTLIPKDGRWEIIHAADL